MPHQKPEFYVLPRRGGVVTAPWELGRVRSARDRNWSAEVTVSISNGSARVDVWYGVDWIGQWAWDARHGFGERRQGNRRLNDDTKRDLDRALGVLGSETAVKLPANLRAPFGCEFIEGLPGAGDGRWRIHDANDDAIASVSPLEEGYARLIVEALNFDRANRSLVESRANERLALIQALRDIAGMYESPDSAEHVTRAKEALIAAGEKP